jgi:hypothetical protein
MNFFKSLFTTFETAWQLGINYKMARAFNQITITKFSQVEIVKIHDTICTTVLKVSKIVKDLRGLEDF